MKRSEFYKCLHKQHNTCKEDEELKCNIGNIIEDEDARRNPLRGTILIRNFQKISYNAIRKNANWKKLSYDILKEELHAFKPYGTWRGFSTFVFEPMQEKFMIRVIREIWAFHVLNTKLANLWLEYNYSPHIDRHGYKRCKINYNNTQKLFN